MNWYDRDQKRHGIDPHTNNSQNDKAAKTASIEIIRTVSSSDTIKPVL